MQFSKHSTAAALLLAFALALSVIGGCGSPPPPRSAKTEIKAAEEAMESGRLLAKGGKYDLAKSEYERALGEINNGEAFATGSELAQLGDLKQEARKRKIDCETRALEAAARPKPVANQDKSPDAV